MEGITRVFKNVKTTDKFLFTYAGYKDKVIELTKFSNNGESLNNSTIAIELEPYAEGETHEIGIHIGGMGKHDRGNVTVTNTRTNESFTVSQKSRKSFLRTIVNTIVALGDELVFTRRGFRPVHVKFKYSIPERINIAPIKGMKTDEQFGEF